MGLAVCVLCAAIDASVVACGPAKGHQGETCNTTTGSNWLDGTYWCDDELVCVEPQHTCEACSSVDRNAVCDLLHACENGRCVACPGGPNHCGDGAWGRSCTDAGTCDAPLVCAAGNMCIMPDELKPDAG